MREYELVVVGVMKTDYSKRGTEGIIMNIADMVALRRFHFWWRRSTLPIP